MTSAEIYQGWKEAAEKLANLLEQKERLEVEIAKQRRKLVAWETLRSEGDESGWTAPVMEAVDSAFRDQGLSNACRTVMRSSRKEWMTTYEIQVGLREIGFSLEKYKAPAASITTTVNRMVEAGEVVVERRSNPGATEYKWVGPNFGAPSSLANYIADIERAKREESLDLSKRVQKRLSGK